MLFNGVGHTCNGTKVDGTTRKSHQYSDTSLCYQVKIELHTGLDMRRLYLYTKLSFKQTTLRKLCYLKPPIPTIHGRAQERSGLGRPLGLISPRWPDSTPPPRVERTPGPKTRQTSRSWSRSGHNRGRNHPGAYSLAQSPVQGTLMCVCVCGEVGGGVGDRMWKGTVRLNTRSSCQKSTTRRKTPKAKA